MGVDLYKGLKNPRVCFGLTDKYSEYAVGSAGGGLICLASLPSFIGFFGALIGAGIGIGGVWYTFHNQKTKGLYNKMKNNDEIHIFPKRFRKSSQKKQQIKSL